MQLRGRGKNTKNGVKMTKNGLRTDILSKLFTKLKKKKIPLSEFFHVLGYSSSIGEVLKNIRRQYAFFSRAKH